MVGWMVEQVTEGGKIPTITCEVMEGDEVTGDEATGGLLEVMEQDCRALGASWWVWGGR